MTHNPYYVMVSVSGSGAVCPGSMSAEKGQEAGNAVWFAAKLEGLQLSGTPL